MAQERHSNLERISNLKSEMSMNLSHILLVYLGRCVCKKGSPELEKGARQAEGVWFTLHLYTVAALCA